MSSWEGAEIDCLLGFSLVNSYPLPLAGSHRNASRWGQSRESLEVAAHGQHERGAKLISTNLLSLLLIPSFREVQKCELYFSSIAMNWRSFSFGQ